MSFKLLVAAAFAASLSTAASAAVVVDQAQLSASGGLANITAFSHPLQSFKTDASNIAGGGFFLGIASGTTDAGFEIGLWSALPNAVGAVLLASDTVHVANGSDVWVEGFWAPIATTLGATYYLTIDAIPTDFGSLAGVFHGDPYANGELYLRDAGGPNYLTYASDTKFRTYTDNSVAAVPEPATWALMILGFGSAGAVLRRRRLASV